jgi:hypothetical protein
MSPALTNGKTTLEPDLVEFHPIAELSHSDELVPLETQLLFGPVRERLPAAKGTLWWGRFSVADRVGLTAYAGQGARLRVRILDLEFRVLEEQAQTGTLRISASVTQSGLVFFQLINEGELDELVFLQVASNHAGMFVPARAKRPSSPLARLLGRLRRVMAPRPVGASRVAHGRAIQSPHPGCAR